MEATYFTVTVAATGYVLAQTLPLWVASLIFGVVFIHEMSHYVSAFRAGRDVWLPFFLPLFYGVHGGTYVGGEDADSDTSIALAGPTVGAGVSLVALLVFIAMRFPPGIYLSLWLLVFQLYSGTIGSDGRKYRKARKVVEDAEPRLGSPAILGDAFAFN